MFWTIGGTQTRRLPQHRPSLRVPWLKILLIVAIVVAIVTVIAVASGRYSNSIYQEWVTAGVSTAPALEPERVPAPVVAKEWPKVHVEWRLIGTARNGDEVLALQMPSNDELISVPRAVFENLPPGVPDEAWALGLPTGKGTVILFVYAQTAPWVYTYWKTVTEIPLTALEGVPCAGLRDGWRVKGDETLRKRCLDYLDSLGVR